MIYEKFQSCFPSKYFSRIFLGCRHDIFYKKVDGYVKDEVTINLVCRFFKMREKTVKRLKSQNDNFHTATKLNFLSKYFFFANFEKKILIIANISFLNFTAEIQINVRIFGQKLKFCRSVIFLTEVVVEYDH